MEMIAGYEPGILAGIIFFLGAIIIWRLPRYKWLAAGVLLALITPIATLGFWYSTGDLGISDWDYYFSLHTTHRNTLLQHHELPHWNPYTCGGTAGLADPEFRFFTPTFLLQLIFGIPAGFRVAIWLATATGAVGILMLGKRLQLTVYGALLASITVAFSSVNILEIVEGHPNIFAAMFVPWVFWAWLAAYRNETIKKKKLWPMITGAFLAATFFQGGIYLLMYTGIAFLVLPFLTRRPKDALLTGITAGLWGLGFAAIKLIPVILWLQQFQDQAYASSAATLAHLDKILLGRILHGAEDIIPNQGGGWHEYGAYVGPFVLILSLLGFAANAKKRIPQALIVAGTLALFLSSAGPILKPLFDQAPFLPRSNISRVILFTIIPLGLLAGFGIDSIKGWLKQLIDKKTPILRLLLLTPLVLIGIVAGDLITLTYSLSEQAFVLPRVVTPIEPAPTPIAYTAFEYKTRHNGVDYTRAYEAVLKGYGSLSYCSVLGPKAAVRTIHDEVDKDILSVGEGNSFDLLTWSPNKTVARISTQEESDILLNTNYANGWTINNQPAEEITGRVGTSLPPGDYLLTFKYKTPGLIPGTAISIATLVIAGLFTFRRRSRN